MKNKSLLLPLTLMVIMGVLIVFLFQIEATSAQRYVDADTSVSYPQPPVADGRIQTADGTWVMPAGAKLTSPPPPAASPGQKPAAVSQPDNFGYYWDDSLPLNWIDATSGIDTGMSGSSSGQAIGPISLPFSFRYYEHVYSSLYIAASGYVSLDENSSWPWQPQIPSPSIPNTIIAPYANPLNLAASGTANRVYYLSGGTAPNRYFVVEWYQVTSIYDGNDTFTYQVVLHENGNIDFQYQTMNYIGGHACGSIGIEDSRGLDGLEQMENCLEAPSNRAVRFYRPAADARLDIYPEAFGQFATADTSKTYQIFIRNTGDIGSDTFDLIVANSAGWNTSFFNENGQTPLTDSNNNGMPDTGLLAPAGNITITVKVDVPTSAVAGSNNITNLTLQSDNNPNVVQVADIRTAVPSPFAQSFRAHDGAMSYFLAHPQKSQMDTITPSYYYGYDSTVAELGNGNLLYTWEKFHCIDSNCNLYGNVIEFLIANACGQTVTNGIRQLASHATATMDTYDYDTTTAVAPNGKIGILWRRSVTNDLGESNHNIYFVILDSNGNLLLAPVNLTKNTTWGDYAALNVDTFSDPIIAATADNRFVLAWEKEHQESGGWVNDIYYAAYNSIGNPVKNITQLTNDTPGYSEFILPRIATLSSSRAIITWVNRVDGNDDVYYAVINSSGTLLKTATNLSVDESVVDWWNGDVVQMSDGRILVAWEAWGCFPSEWTARTRFAILDGAYNTIVPATCLNNEPVAAEKDGNISLAADNSGNAILTWINGPADTLYYALLKSSGALVTPPMPFYTAKESLTSTGTFSINSHGFGNTSYKQFEALACQTFLPAALNNYISYFEGPWEVESNNASSQANGPIRSGQTYLGVMSGAADVSDYFSFQLSTSHTVEIWLTQIAAGHNYNLTLRDANLNVVKHSGNLNNQNEYILTGNLSPGTYYIQISNSSGTNSTQPYNLRTIYE